MIPLRLIFTSDAKLLHLLAFPEQRLTLLGSITMIISITNPNTVTYLRYFNYLLNKSFVSN